MKHEYRTTREISLPVGGDLPKGTLVATIETHTALPVERVVSAIGSGFATEAAPESPAPALPAEAPAAKPAKPPKA